MKVVATIEELSGFLGVSLLPYFPVGPTDHPGIRLAVLARNLATAVRNGDADAIAIACSLMVKDPGLPFGKLIKSNLARALRRHVDLLNDSQRAALLAKTAELLGMEFCPREAEDYCRLVRKFGPETAERMSRVRPVNDKARRLVGSLVHG